MNNWKLQMIWTFNFITSDFLGLRRRYPSLSLLFIKAWLVQALKIVLFKLVLPSVQKRPMYLSQTMRSPHLLRNFAILMQQTSCRLLTRQRSDFPEVEADCSLLKHLNGMRPRKKLCSKMLFQQLTCAHRMTLIPFQPRLIVSICKSRLFMKIWWMKSWIKRDLFTSLAHTSETQSSSKSWRASRSITLTTSQAEGWLRGVQPFPLMHQTMVQLHSQINSWHCYLQFQSSILCLSGVWHLLLQSP